jgi:hypothetical protein
MKSIILWNIMPCSPLSVNRCFGGTYCLHLQGRSYKFSKKPERKQVLNYFFDLNMEAICSSETSVDTRRSAWHHIPEDDTLHIPEKSEAFMALKVSKIFSVHHPWQLNRNDRRFGQSLRLWEGKRRSFWTNWNFNNNINVLHVLRVCNY